MTKNEIMTYLLNLAFDNGIAVSIERVHSHTPSAANVNQKRVFINSNWYRPEEIIFQLAHELGHIFCKHGDLDVLYFSPSKRGIELEANRYAIKLLLPFYLDGKEPYYVNLEQFIDCFSIPMHLENIVEQEMREKIREI